MIGFLFGEAVRDLRRAGTVAVSAVVLITLALTAVGGFWLLSSNLARAVAEWKSRARLVVYLKTDPGAREARELVERVQALPGVASARYVGKDEALATLRRALGKDADVTEGLPSNPLPASLDVTPTAEAVTADGARALVARLAALPAASDVEGGLEGIDRVAHWQSLLTLLGLCVGATLGVAAILTVTTATRLVLHARRDETEIMRLVGAPEVVIRLPLLLQGLMQGLLGALLATLVLTTGFRFLGPRLEPLVTLTLGLPHLEFLALWGLGALVAAGMVLGGVGGFLVRGAAR